MRKARTSWKRGSIMLAAAAISAAALAAPASGEPRRSSSGLSVQPSERLRSMASRTPETVSWGEVMEEIKVTYSGEQTLEAVLVASVICDGRRVCAEGQSRPVSMRSGETRSAASMFGRSGFFDEGTLTGVICCEGQTSIGPEGISLKQAQAAFGASVLREHRAVLVIAAVPAEGGPTITNPLAMYFAMTVPVVD